MEAVTTTVKSALNPGNIFKFVVGFIVVNALLELTGFADYVYRPIATLKNKFGGAP